MPRATRRAKAGGICPRQRATMPRSRRPCTSQATWREARSSQTLDRKHNQQLPRQLPRIQPRLASRSEHRFDLQKGWPSSDPVGPGGDGGKESPVGPSASPFLAVAVRSTPQMPWHWPSTSQLRWFDCTVWRASFPPMPSLLSAVASTTELYHNRIALAIAVEC